MNEEKKIEIKKRRRINLIFHLSPFKDNMDVYNNNNNNNNSNAFRFCEN
jgi:hypothetical protein